MALQVEKVVNLYRSLAQVPSIIGGRVCNNGTVIQSYWSQRDLERNKSLKFQQTHILNKNLIKENDLLPVDISNELLSNLSPTENFRAVLRENFDSNKRKQYLEIWQNSHLWRNVDLSSLEIHLDVYTDGEFGMLEWSPCETKVAYIAEKKLPKQEPFYKRKDNKHEHSEGNVSHIVKGEEHLYRQDWGEQLVGKFNSVICVYDTQLDIVTVINGFPEGLCPGQVIWTPTGDGFVGIAWDTEPRKLGLYACTNRSNYLFNLTLNGEYNQISANGKCVRSPRLSPNGKELVWLERELSGPHHSTHALMKISWPLLSELKPKTIIDIIDTEVTISSGSFYGIYNQALSKRCFCEDSKRLVFSTVQQLVTKTFVVNIDSGDITELKFPDGSQAVLDIKNDIIIAVRSNIKTPDYLVIAKFPDEGQENIIKWESIKSTFVVEGLDEKDYNYHYMHLSHNNDDEVRSFNAIYFGPDAGSEKSTPLVVLVHGGPHAASVNSYSLSTSLYALLGFATLQVNYRGSTGVGQKSVDFLPSRIGDADVKDCKLAMEECLKTFSQLDENRVALSGGSHGGFLVTHLSGQYPDIFRAVVTRNPVTDIASMYLTSDIPDWCSIEAGTVFTQKGPISESLMLAQRRASPIVNVHKVKAPTLMLIGSKDLRVPSSQGIDYYHRLRANGVKTKMHLYEDNHSLATVSVEFDTTVNLMLWILEHTK